MATLTTKISLGATALIVLLALFLGWRDHGRITGLQNRHQELRAELTSRGFAWGADGSLQLPAKSSRADRISAAKQAAKKFLAYGTEMEALGKETLDSPDEATRQRIIEQMDEFKALDAEQLKILIDEVLHASGEGGEEMTKSLIRFALGQLIASNPREAVAMLDGRHPELDELLRKPPFVVLDPLLCQALHAWAEEDPQAALRWYRERNPERVQTLALIQGMASKDPRQALALIDEFGMDPKDLVRNIIRTKMETAEECREGLALLREWSETCKDELNRKSVMTTCLRELVMESWGSKQPFARAMERLKPANLREEELDLALKDLDKGIVLSETGLWIEWLDRTLTPKKARMKIQDLVESWTERDVKAAARWLDAAPENELKYTATLAYAERIAAKDPQEAVARALAVPESPARTEALKVIHQGGRRDNEPSRQALDEFSR